jgi:DNA-binding MarR family transcriptional regulator
VVSKKEYIALSEFRSRVASFLAFSENAAKSAGLTPVQYLLLLHIGGIPGREWATVRELADRLQGSHHNTVLLVQRCEANGLVSKKRNADDARLVEVHLTARGRKLLERIASQHKSELRTLDNVFRVRHVTRKGAS